MCLLNPPSVFAQQQPLEDSLDHLLGVNRNRHRNPQRVANGAVFANQHIKHDTRAWYGPLAGEGKPLQPKNPLDLVKDLHGPVLGLYGGPDAGISPESVEKRRAALKASGSAAAMRSQIDVYPDTPHAFNADYRPSYRKEPAEDGWKKALAWFKANGVS